MIKIISIFFTFFFLIKCTTKAYYKETELLNSFLVEKGFYIPQFSFVYIVVPKIGCYGCMAKHLKIIDSNINEQNVNKVLIITNNHEIIPHSLRKKIKIIDDNNGEITNSIIDPINTTFILTEKKNIKTIQSLNIQDTNKIKDFLNF